jgi:uncharacterized protein YcbX
MVLSLIELGQEKEVIKPCHRCMLSKLRVQTTAYHAPQPLLMSCSSTEKLRHSMGLYPQCAARKASEVGLKQSSSAHGAYA